MSVCLCRSVFTGKLLVRNNSQHMLRPFVGVADGHLFCLRPTNMSNSRFVVAVFCCLVAICLVNITFAGIIRNNDHHILMKGLYNPGGLTLEANGWQSYSFQHVDGHGYATSLQYRVKPFPSTAVLDENPGIRGVECDAAASTVTVHFAGSQQESDIGYLGISRAFDWFELLQCEWWSECASATKSTP